MNILAIDPGTNTSGVAFTDGAVWCVWTKFDNKALLDSLRGFHNAPDSPFGQFHSKPHSALCIEQMAGIGATVGGETLRAVEWAGRFYESWERRYGEVVWVPRQFVKSWHLKGRFKRDEKPQGTDARIRKVMLEKYGKDKLKGCTSHAMQAAALAAYWLETKGTHETR